MRLAFEDIKPLEVESSSKMEQAVKDFSYKRRKSGFNNIDLEVKRINLRVEKMLLAHEREMHEDDTKLNLARKFYKMWKGARPDKLGCLREAFQEDMTSMCCVEIVQAYETCFMAKQYFHNIRT